MKVFTTTGRSRNIREVELPDNLKDLTKEKLFDAVYSGTGATPYSGLPNIRTASLHEYLNRVKQAGLIPADDPRNKDFWENYSLLPVEGVNKSDLEKAFQNDIVEMPGGKGIYLQPSKLYTGLQALQSYKGINPSINALKGIDLNNADLNAVLNNLTQANVLKPADVQPFQTAYNALDQETKMNDRTRAIANEETYKEQQENLNNRQKYIQDILNNPIFKEAKTKPTATQLGQMSINELKDLHKNVQEALPQTQAQVQPQQSSSSSQQQAPAQFGNNNTNNNISSSSSSGFQPIGTSTLPPNQMAQYQTGNVQSGNNQTNSISVNTGRTNPLDTTGATSPYSNALDEATKLGGNKTQQQIQAENKQKAEDTKKQKKEELEKKLKSISNELNKRNNEEKTIEEGVQQLKDEGATDSGKPLTQVVSTNKGINKWQKLDKAGYPTLTPPEYGETTYDTNISDLETAINPRSESNKNIDQSHLNTLKNAYKSNLQQHAIKPYMEGMSGKPNQLLKQLTDELYGPYEKQLKDESREEFINTILPKIRSQYMQPGVVHNGQMERAINHALEKQSKGLNAALIRGRREATQDVNQFLNQRKEYARLAQDAAKGDMLDKLGIGAQIEQYRKGIHFRGTQALEHALNQRQRQQDQANAVKEWTNNDLINKRNYDSMVAHGYYNMGNPGVPTQAQYMGKNPYPENSNFAGSGNRAASGAFSGLAAYINNNQNPSYKKAGGRVHKAEGGQINPNELLVESHFTGLDPLKALEKQMKQRAIMGFLADRNQQRQAYAEGGRVDPIQQGAQKAEEYAGHSEIRKYIQKLQNPPQRSGFTNLVNDVMTALHNTPGHHFMKGPAAAYTSVVENVDKREKANQDREASIANLEYKLGQDIEKKRLEHEKMANQRSMQNELLQTQRDIANAKIGNMREIFMMKGEQQPLKLNRAETNTLDEAVHSLKAAEPFIQKIDHLKDVISRIETGSNTLRSGWGETGKGTLSSWRLGVTGHKGSMEDYDLAHKGLTDLANDIGSTFGKSSRIGIGLLKLIHQGKANLGMEKGAINEILDQMKKKVQEEAKLSENIIDNVDLGVAPSHSVAQFVKASRQPRAPETSSPAIKTNTFTPEKNERLNDLQNFFNRDAYQTTKWLGK